MPQRCLYTHLRFSPTHCVLSATRGSQHFLHSDAVKIIPALTWCRWSHWTSAYPSTSVPFKGFDGAHSDTLALFTARGGGGGVGAHLQLLLAVLGGILAALALPPQFLQLTLAFLQTLSFVFVLNLVLLKSRLQEEKHRNIVGKCRNHPTVATALRKTWESKPTSPLVKSCSKTLAVFCPTLNSLHRQELT